MENETHTDANNVLAADLSTLIDIYKVRLAKIEKATNEKELHKIISELE